MPYRPDGVCARPEARAKNAGWPLRDIVYIVTPLPEESGRIAEALSGEQLDARTFDSAEALIAQLGAGACGCVVVPVDLPGMGVRSLIDEIRRRQLCLTIVVLGREDDLRIAVDLVRAGAAEFVEHPLNTRRLRAAVHRAIASARVAHAHCR
jgi:FixJ family two-component response regulator